MLLGCTPGSTDQSDSTAAGKASIIASRCASSTGGFGFDLLELPTVLPTSLPILPGGYVVDTQHDDDCYAVLKFGAAFPFFPETSGKISNWQTCFPHAGCAYGQRGGACVKRLSCSGAGHRSDVQRRCWGFDNARPWDVDCGIAEIGLFGVTCPPKSGPRFKLVFEGLEVNLPPS